MSCLRAQLRRLHQLVGGPTYRQLCEQAALAGHKLPTSTAQELLVGQRTPRWTTVEAFILACVQHARSRRRQLPHTLHDIRVWRRQYDSLDVDSDPDRPERPKAGARERPDGEMPHRWRIYVEFLLAIDAAHYGLREVAQARTHLPNRRVASNRSVHVTGLYAEREKFLASAAPEVAAAGERVFLRLIEVRDAVRAGARLDAKEYHVVYHPFAEALWAFRMAVRTQLGQPPLTPGDLHRADWLDQERCAAC